MKPSVISVTVTKFLPRIGFALRVISLFVLLLFSPFSAQPSTQFVELAVITHASNGQSRIHLRTLRAVFGMRMQAWPDGVAIKVFILSDGSLHDAFCREILGMLSYRLQKHWDRLLFSGTGEIPIVLNSEEEMKMRVANTPGAIGYLSKGKIDDSVLAVQIKD